MRNFIRTIKITLITMLLVSTGFSQDTTLSVTSAGNVGIGTTTPTDKLVVGDDFGVKLSGIRMTIGNAFGPSAINLGTDIDQRAFIFWDNSNNHMALGTRSGGTTFGQTLVLKDGNIGSGTSDPAEKLDIRGNIAVNGTVDGVDVSDLKDDFDNRQSSYTEYSDLDFPTSVGHTWTKITSNPGIFTKASDDSKIEVYFNGRVTLSNMNGVAAAQVKIIIDDTKDPQFENYGVIYFIPNAPTSDHLSIMAVFDDLAAGQHTVSIWARNRPTNAASVIRIDQGNYGAKIIVKETW